MSQSSKQKKAAARKRAQQRVANANKPKTRQAMEDQSVNLQTALLNLRQMYDQAVMEKDALTSQIQNRDQLITALAAEYGGLEVAQVTLQAVAQGEWIGYETEGDVEKAAFVIKAVDGPSEDEQEIVEALDALETQEVKYESEEQESGEAAGDS